MQFIINFSNSYPKIPPMCIQNVNTIYDVLYAIYLRNPKLMTLRIGLSIYNKPMGAKNRQKICTDEDLSTSTDELYVELYQRVCNEKNLKEGYVLCLVVVDAQENEQYV